MSGPATAREALIVEALGEVARLLDRLDGQRSALENASLALSRANTEFDDRLETFGSRMATLAQHVQIKAAEHIIRRSNQAANDSLNSQQRAIEAAVRVAFSAQLDSKLTRLTLALETANQRAARAWDHWLALIATGVASAACTWLIASPMAFKC